MPTLAGRGAIPNHTLRSRCSDRPVAPTQKRLRESHFTPLDFAWLLTSPWGIVIVVIPIAALVAIVATDHPYAFIVLCLPAWMGVRDHRRRGLHTV